MIGLVALCVVAFAAAAFAWGWELSRRDTMRQWQEADRAALIERKQELLAEQARAERYAARLEEVLRGIAIKHEVLAEPAKPLLRVPDPEERIAKMISDSTIERGAADLLTAAAEQGISMTPDEARQIAAESLGVEAGR